MLAVAAAELTRTPGAVVSMAEPDVCAPIDANGNMTTNGTQTFSWNARNQLISIVTGVQEAEFAYDGLARNVRRILKIDGTTQSDEAQLWCSAQPCEDREWASGTLTRESFTFGVVVNGTTYYVAKDHLGSVWSLNGASGTTVTKYRFDPWGLAETESGTAIIDAEFGLIRASTMAPLLDAQYRVFDPRLGRWISEDPMGIAEDLNLYRYVGNQPTVFVDPGGLQRAKILDFICFGCVSKIFRTKDFKTGYEWALAECNTGTLVWAEFVNINKIASAAAHDQWYDWQNDFDKRCLSGETDGKLRHIECMPTIGFGLGTVVGGCSCCERCK